MTGTFTRRLLAATVAVPLGGCYAGGHEIGLLDAPALPALEDEPIALGESAPPDAGRSLVGFDRRHWTNVTVMVPARQVQNGPDYAGLSSAESPSSDWPTTSSCLGSKRRPGDEVTVGGYVLGYTAWLTVAWLVEMPLGRLPWKVERSPQGAYVRQAPRAAADLWPWVVFEPADPDDDA